MFSGNYDGVAFSHDKLTVGTAATASAASKLVYTLTGGETLPADACYMEALTHSARYTVDGTAPVAASVGHLLSTAAVVGQWVVGEANVAALSLISEDGSNSIVNITYFRRS